jgi:uncharacterized membrane protein
MKKPKESVKELEDMRRCSACLYIPDWSIWFTNLKITILLPVSAGTERMGRDDFLEDAVRSPGSVELEELKTAL